MHFFKIILILISLKALDFVKLFLYFNKQEKRLS